jgi:hypothetical protein
MTCSNYYQFASSQSRKKCQQQCIGSQSSSACSELITYGSSSFSIFLNFTYAGDLVGLNLASQQFKSSFGCIFNQRGFTTGIWGLGLVS